MSLTQCNYPPPEYQKLFCILTQAARVGIAFLVNRRWSNAQPKPARYFSSSCVRGEGVFSGCWRRAAPGTIFIFIFRASRSPDMHPVPSNRKLTASPVPENARCPVSIMFEFSFHDQYIWLKRHRACASFEIPRDSSFPACRGAENLTFGFIASRKVQKSVLA